MTACGRHLESGRDNPLRDVVDIKERLLGGAEEELRLQLQDERELAIVLDGYLHLGQCGADLVTLLSLKEKIAHGRLEEDEAHIRLRGGWRASWLRVTWAVGGERAHHGPDEETGEQEQRPSCGGVQEGKRWLRGERGGEAGWGRAWWRGRRWRGGDGGGEGDGGEAGGGNGGECDGA